MEETTEYRNKIPKISFRTETDDKTQGKGVGVVNNDREIVRSNDGGRGTVITATAAATSQCIALLRQTTSY